MSNKTLVIRKGNNLKLELNQVLIYQEEEKISFPIEDIGIILIENPYINISSRVITELNKQNVIIVICDHRYMPFSYIIPIVAHYNQFGIQNKQIKQSVKIKKQLWTNVIYQKIINQAKVVDLTINNFEESLELRKNAESLKYNDSTNLEGNSARMFFKALYGNDFIRQSDSPISLSLNYGYSILHSSMTRILISRGLNTSFGIWHESDKNYYNLSSDFIEIFRPLIDYIVYWNKSILNIPLPKEIRKILVKVLDLEMECNGKIVKVDYAMETMVNTYISILENDTINEFPKINILTQKVIYDEFGL